MGLTEDEAKTKWCPMARVGADTSGLGSLNRDHVKGAVPEARCIGSACMAWRWRVEDHEAALEAYEDSLNIGGISSREVPELSGYCGLAGRPE